MGGVLVVVPEVKVVLACWAEFMLDVVCFSDGIGRSLHDADDHPFWLLISESGHRATDWESIAVESVDGPVAARLEFCDLFLRSLHCR